MGQHYVDVKEEGEGLRAKCPVDIKGDTGEYVNVTLVSESRSFE